MIGGAGLLGGPTHGSPPSAGTPVTAGPCPPLPEGASLPSEMKIEHGNDQEMSDGERHVHPEGSM